MVLNLRGGATKQEMAALDEALQKCRRKKAAPKVLKAKKYCGTLKLKEDPLVIQKRLRDEWE